MLRVRFHQTCSAAGRTWRPGDERDFPVGLADEIANLGAGEIIGPAEPASVTPAPISDKPERAAKKRTPLP